MVKQEENYQLSWHLGKICSGGSILGKGRSDQNCYIVLGLEHVELKEVGLYRLAWKMACRVSVEQTCTECNYVPGAKSRKTSKNQPKDLLTSTTD